MYTNTKADMAYQEMVKQQNHSDPNNLAGLAINHKLSNNITISPASAVSNVSPNQYQISLRPPLTNSPESYHNLHSAYHQSENHSQNQNHSSQSPPLNKNLSHVPCKFFRQGACQAGDSCPFSHSLSDFESLSRQPCKYYMKGKCKFGMKCALGHYLPDGRRVNNYTPKQTPRYHNHDKNNQHSNDIANVNNATSKNPGLAISTQTQTPRYSSAPSYISNTPSSSVGAGSLSTNSTTFSSNSNLNKTPMSVYSKSSCTTTPNSAAQHNAPSPTSLLSSPLQYSSSSIIPYNSVVSTPVAYNNAPSRINNPYFDGSAIFDEDEKEDYASSCGSTSSYSGDNSYMGNCSDFTFPKLNPTSNNNYTTLIQNNAPTKISQGSRRISTSSSNSGSISFLNNTQYNNKIVSAKSDPQIVMNNSSNSNNDFGSKYPTLRNMSSSSHNYEMVNNIGPAVVSNNNISILNSPIYSKKSGTNVPFLQPFNTSLNSTIAPLANGSDVSTYGGDTNFEYQAAKSSPFEASKHGFTRSNWSGGLSDVRTSLEANPNASFGSGSYDSMFYMQQSSLKSPKSTAEVQTEDEYNLNESVDFTDDLKDQNKDYFDLVPSMLGSLIISQESER